MLPDRYVRVANFWPPRHRDGAVIPHKLEAPLMLRALGVDFLRFFDKVVPDEFWAEDSDEDGFLISISCPCGEVPTLRFLLRSFSLAECGCGRIFMHDGRQVRVGKLVN